MNYRIVGLVRDVRYRSMREPMLPIAFVPLHATDANGALLPIREGTFHVRTSGDDPSRLTLTLRQEVARGGLGFRVTNIHTQMELNQSHTVRERLLAMLGLFFAGVALLLAGLGLYGVVAYSVLQRRREIAMRLALGAKYGEIARRVTVSVFSMVLAGALAGLVVGMASVRYIETLFYQVNPADPVMFGLPSLSIVIAAALAALPALIRALKIDTVLMLRGE